MFDSSRKLLAVACFAVILIGLVNLAWWVFYDHTKQMLDQQLTRRLLSTAKAAAAALPVEVIENLILGDLDAFSNVTVILEEIRAVDSLAELFILNENYTYLATTSLETDSSYFLAELNSPYIDSLFFGFSRQAVATLSYKTGKVYLKSAFAPLYDTDGYLLAVLGVEANVDYFDDLTALKRNLYYSGGLSLLGGVVFGLLFLLYQRRVNQAEQRLFVNETHSYLGRMVAVVSHEIKNPLMIIRASAERLLKKDKSAECTFIVEETDRLNGIVTGYLDFAKAGGSILTDDLTEEVNLSAIVSNIRKHLHEKYPDTEINWIDDETPEDLIFEGYRRSLRQVLLNLLINGAEACLAASKPITIGISAADRGDHVTIRVIDHGPGLSKKERKRIFTPFYTTKQSGSGLGLYLSKKIVVEMGGELIIESVSGQKTEVIINLPKAPKR
jgi:signal transduction histidine kinase